MADLSAAPWTEDRFRAALGSYCFGDISEGEREAVEQHLLECDSCWSHFQRLEESVRILRFEPALQPVLPAGGIVSLLGISSRLEGTFAGHRGFVLLSAAAFALLFAVPVLVELAYQFPQYQALALTLLLPVWAWMFAASVLACWLDVRAVRHDVAAAATTPLALLGAATVALCAGMLAMLPEETTVEATFQTYPAHLGYIKSVFYAWMVGPLFVFLPFHFVVVAQRELAAGRHRHILALLTGDKSGLPPRGAIFLPVWFLGLYLGAILALNYFGVNNLFGNLLPSPNRTLFMSLVLVRGTLWIGLSAGALWWYAACLTELKREALARQALAGMGVTPRPPA